MITVAEAQQYYSDDDPVHDFNHVLRVLALAERLAHEEKADLDIVRTATLLHDIARLDDANTRTGFAMHVDEEGDHAILAGRSARHILHDAHPEFVEAVVHCIEAHRFRNAIEPKTIEAKVLFDADKLDAIGAVGIARAFAYAGHHSMPLWGDVSDGYVPDQSEERHTPHHEFHVKLSRIKDRLYTESGRRMAAARHDFMVAFYEQMAAEVHAKR